MGGFDDERDLAGSPDRVTSTLRHQQLEGNPMTPAEQAKQADLSRSKHRGPPPLLPHAWGAMSARRTSHNTDPRARRDGRSSSIFGATDHPPDAELMHALQPPGGRLYLPLTISSGATFANRLADCGRA